MGELTIERRKKRRDPPNPFSADASAQRNQRHNQRVQNSPNRTQKPNSQPAKNSSLTDLDKKRKEALTRMSDAKPSGTSEQVGSAASSSGISKQNQQQQSSEKPSSRADRLAELRKKSAASKLNAEQHKAGDNATVEGAPVEVVAEVKLVEAKAEIETFSAVTVASSKPAVSQLNVFKIVEETQVKATNDRRKKRRPHAKKGGGRQRQEKRLNRQKYLEYKYAARDILDNPTVPEEHRSNILGQVWAKGERMSVDDSYEFINEKILENILTEEVADKLKSLVRKYTTRR
ncbi:MAG TPA: hypothetical protein EYQ58_01945 [Candidatus Poseidoniales archaeon]|nr:MAG: hypothetical protein CXT70_03190 [Euryarchaeota archaeon]HIF90301.1 hypothetical protein [Candidatus Poseidoniales archaeon]